MVWLNKIILLLLFLFVSQSLYSSELSNDEQIYFNFVDSNNDDKISLSEIEQSISIIFQIVDFNQDGFISNSEIRELKKIINSIK